MVFSLKLCRSSLLISAALLTGVAFVVAVGVIPAVRTDTSPLAMPERAVPAFWVNVVFNLIAATVLGFVAYRAVGRSRFPTTSLGVLSILILIFAYALIDAARAFYSHDPSMHNTSLILRGCSITDALAGLLVIATATFFPKRT
ncbi:hypothetical protein [Geothrix oryzae]|uniref:hypothetical protein n=1 Tax=Geothrix oryzae TaxID=2927975 RepID=UPI002572A9DD|nr:hypothetical protein [Geothrix oryzae]